MQGLRHGALLFLLPMSSEFAPPFFIARLSPSDQQCDAWADQSLLDSMEQGGLDCVAIPDGDVVLQDPSR